MASRLYRGRGAGRGVWGGPLPSRLRRATFPIGGRLRNALRPASIRVVFKVDDVTLWRRYQSQTEPSPATHSLTYTVPTPPANMPLKPRLAYAYGTDEHTDYYVVCFIMTCLRISKCGRRLRRYENPSSTEEKLGTNQLNRKHGLEICAVIHAHLRICKVYNSIKDAWHTRITIPRPFNALHRNLNVTMDDLVNGNKHSYVP